ncbi:hypothetical protein DERF_001650 [Dermatophagoides farinae]|uniref:Uncharacterized protein n=1 Tax=Dermatophagoides farinae TaxID=6954 RepID=A0A922IBB1_DERFA|nr:hypothetical protein DERF_001650 [Dermatophagoides farinae]
MPKMLKKQLVICLNADLSALCIKDLILNSNSIFEITVTVKIIYISKLFAYPAGYLPNWFQKPDKLTIKLK